MPADHVLAALVIPDGRRTVAVFVARVVGVGETHGFVFSAKRQGPLGFKIWLRPLGARVKIDISIAREAAILDQVASLLGIPLPSRRQAERELKLEPKR